MQKENYERKSSLKTKCSCFGEAAGFTRGDDGIQNIFAKNVLPVQTGTANFY